MGRVRQGVEGEAGLFIYLLSYLSIYLLISLHYTRVHNSLLPCYQKRLATWFLSIRGHQSPSQHSLTCHRFLSHHRSTLREAAPPLLSVTFTQPLQWWHSVRSRPLLRLRVDSPEIIPYQTFNLLPSYRTNWIIYTQHYV